MPVTLPPVEFETLTNDAPADPKALDKLMRSFGAEPIPGGGWSVPVDQIQPLPGFNVRVTGTAESEAHIKGLIDLITENGFSPNKPLTAFVVKAAPEEGADPITFLSTLDGHSRMEAVERINMTASEGKKIVRVPLTVAPAGATMADMIVQMGLSDKEKTPFEKAVLLKRLMATGTPEAPVTLEAAAARLGMTKRHAHNLVYLLTLPNTLLSLVITGKVAAQNAVDKAKEVGPEKAEAAFRRALEAAKAKGKEKITARDVKPTAKAEKINARKKEEKPAAKKAAEPAKTKTEKKTAEPANGKDATPAPAPAAAPAETTAPASAATDTDFHREAIRYATEHTSAKDGIAFLKAWLAEEAVAVAELESYMSQPPGSFFDKGLRTPYNADTAGL